jgi:hypothetical protein
LFIIKDKGEYSDFDDGPKRFEIVESCEKELIRSDLFVTMPRTADASFFNVKPASLRHNDPVSKEDIANHTSGTNMYGLTSRDGFFTWAFVCAVAVCFRVSRNIAGAGGLSTFRMDDQTDSFESRAHFSDRDFAFIEESLYVVLSFIFTMFDFID